MSEDPRSWRVAVVSDEAFSARLAELRDAGFGVMQLPPLELAPDVAVAWLEQTAEQVAELLRAGYEVVLAEGGAWAGELDHALGAVGVPPLPNLEPPGAPTDRRAEAVTMPSTRRRRGG